MVQKVCLHQRLGQTSHIASILASLFDIIHDPSIVGLTPSDNPTSNITYERPIALFTVDDEAVVGHFLSAATNNKLTSLQMLFALRHNSLVS